MPTIQVSGRRFGKTAAAAHAAGMPIDAYRELMRQQHERLGAARALLPAQPERLSAVWWDQIARACRPNKEFVQEYLCEFSAEPMGPPSPTFEQLQRNQARNAREERYQSLGLQGFRWEFTRPEWK